MPRAVSSQYSGSPARYKHISQSQIAQNLPYKKIIEEQIKERREIEEKDFYWRQTEKKNQ